MASPQIASVHQLHPAGDVCPTCDQPIPHDRAEEVRRRLEDRAKQQADELTAKLKEDFDREAAEAAERNRLETEEKLTAARAEAAAVARTEAKTQIDAANAQSKIAEDALAAKIAEVAQAKTEMDGKLADAERNKQAAVAEVTQAAARDVAKAKEDATLAAAEQIRTAELEKTSAQQASAQLQSKLEAAEQATIKAVEQAKTDASNAAQVQVNEALAAKQSAEVKAAEAERVAEAIKLDQQTALTAALQEQREALEADKASALSAAKAQAFTETQKLSEKVGELQRALEKKTAEELGEGAEIDLYESLRAEFEDDRFERIKKGLPGADIRHTVMHNGQACGVIVYDSKNHNAWRNDFIAKLRTDQMADNAEHAILTVLKFPQGAKQLHLQDGVLVANPARVVAVVEMLRRHMIQTHTLRMSSQQRAEKTAALYDFITSDQCAGMFERLETHAQQLLDIQVAEKAVHERVWKQQGLAIRSSQKVQAELRGQIDAIIGVAPATEEFL